MPDGKVVPTSAGKSVAGRAATMIHIRGPVGDREIGKVEEGATGSRFGMSRLLVAGPGELAHEADRGDHNSCLA